MKRFTKPDVVALVLCVLFLACSLGPVGSTGRERARRAVCLANLSQLTRAWLSYASDNDGRIINGAAGIYRSSFDRHEDPWVGKCWASNYARGELLPEASQKDQIRRGALWPYVQDLHPYRCPSAYSGEMLNYTAVDAVNGRRRPGTFTGWDYLDDTGLRVGDTVVWLKNTTDIISPGPAERMVFIDEGSITPDSFNTHYQQELWWDDPPIRHSDGFTASFADGHVEHWQWNGTDTIRFGRDRERGHPGNHYMPETAEGAEDLHRFQRAVWGRLGYTPEQP